MDFSVTSANKTVRSLVLFLWAWSQSWPYNSLHKCWTNLTLKCYPNTFVEVDAQIVEGCQQIITYLKGYSYSWKALLQETMQSETYGKYSWQYKKNNFMLNAGSD